MSILRNVHITVGEHLMLVFLHSPDSRQSVKKHKWIVSKHALKIKCERLFFYSNYQIG